MFRSIIVGIDGRSGGRDALALARAISGAEGAKLALACSYLVDPVGTRLVPAEAHAFRDRATAYLEAAHAEVEALDVEVHPVATSSPARGLHHLAAEIGADLIVVGSTHRGPIGRVVPGSVTQQVLQGAPCAVAVAPTGLAELGPVDLARIGCAYDGSRESREALDTSRVLADEMGSVLEVIDVLAPPAISDAFPGYPGGFVVPEPWEDLKKAVQAELDDAVASVTGVRATGVMPEGDPAEQIVARSGTLDLLVMGSRGYGPVRRVLVGTVAGGVVRQARCPVIVVPRGVHPADAEEPSATASTAA